MTSRGKYIWFINPREPSSERMLPAVPWLNSPMELGPREKGDEWHIRNVNTHNLSEDDRHHKRRRKRQRTIHRIPSTACAYRERTLYMIQILIRLRLSRSSLNAAAIPLRSCSFSKFLGRGTIRSSNDTAVTIK
jgi:hypothetical protein